jgi:hypothetical protein
MKAFHFSRRQLRRTALATALGMSLVSGAVMAQSNASGVIFGQAEPTAGSTVHLVNVDTGMVRDIAVDSAGRYRASSLPVGRYTVTLQRDGQAVSSRENVQVSVGTGVDVSFLSTSSAANATTLEGVQVVGTSLPAIDVSAVDSRTVLTSDQLQKLPLGRNVNAAALLAPGTVGGDSRYGGVVSFGGASAAENQNYVNGFPVTNALTGLGFTTLPIDSIDQEQVFTGGYGAEYGRSTGGVVNIITKRGTNTWKGSVEASWVPRYLRDSPRSLYRTNGVLFANNTDNKVWQTDYTVAIGGPLIKDKLFFYGAGEMSKTGGGTTLGTITAPNINVDDFKATRWLAKIDWNITDSHILEFTGLGDDGQTETQIYSTPDYATGVDRELLGSRYRKNTGVAGSTPGGTVYIGKYTGYLTDNLTVNALYGKSKSEHSDSVAGLSGGECPGIVDARDVVNPFVSCSPLSGNLLVPGAVDKTKAWRLDVEYNVGDHTVRAGLDNQTLESFSGNQTIGGATWTYQDAPADGVLDGYTNVNIPAGTQYLVQNSFFSAAGNVKVEQEAQFIEDRWQVNDRWMIYAGLRNEQFKNFNTDGVVYVKQRHQLAPRLGVTWDVFGDSTFKVYANAGRYHLAIPSNVAIRGAGPQLFTTQYYTFTGTDPLTGAPQGIVPVTDIRYANGADGSSPDPQTLSAKGLSAYYQDEYILGFDKQLAPSWTFGAKATMRKLGSIIDDMCDSRPFTDWADRNGITVSPDAQIPGCVLFNPGKGNEFTIDLNNDGTYENINLSKADLGFPDLKRKYLALNVYIEHQFDQRWYGKAEYVWSKSYGNSEGLLKSDIGQIDPAVTQDWDYRELMVGSNGPLANDRKHQFKAYGYFQLNPEWLFGANLAIASGRPKNCFGVGPSDPFGYGASFFYCDGAPAPRGSRGRLPWTEQLDLSVEWRPAFADHQLALTADVYNVFSQQRELSVIEVGEQASGEPSVNYLRPLSYQTPRYFRFTARYDFSL